MGSQQQETANRGYSDASCTEGSWQRAGGYGLQKQRWEMSRIIPTGEWPLGHGKRHRLRICGGTKALVSKIENGDTEGTNQTEVAGDMVDGDGKREEGRGKRDEGRGKSKVGNQTTLGLQVTRTDMTPGAVTSSD